VLRVLCLDGIRFVVGDLRILIEVVGMIDLGEALLALDLLGAIRFQVYRVTHLG